MHGARSPHHRVLQVLHFHCTWSANLLQSKVPKVYLILGSLLVVFNLDGPTWMVVSCLRDFSENPEMHVTGVGAHLDLIFRRMES